MIILDGTGNDAAETLHAPDQQRTRGWDILWDESLAADRLEGRDVIEAMHAAVLIVQEDNQSLHFWRVHPIIDPEHRLYLGCFQILDLWPKP